MVELFCKCFDRTSRSRALSDLLESYLDMATIQETDVNLPGGTDHVFARLNAKGNIPADIPFVLFLFPPGANDGHKITPPNGGDCQLNTQYDLGSSADALINYIVIFAGGVLFKAKGNFTLTAQFFVAGNKLPDTASTSVTGNAGETKSFEITCRFV